MCLTGVVRRTPVPRHAKEARDGASIQSEKTAGPDPTGRNVPPVPPFRPQPGDTPVSPGLGPKKGTLRRDPRFSYDQETAEFQRFVILESG